MDEKDKIKVLIASDSFKGSLSSLQVSDAVIKGIIQVFPNAETDVVPLADGGEGTVDAFLSAVGGHKAFCDVFDPLMRPLNTYYGILKDGKTAVVELAAASGIERLSKDELNPLKTTSYGTGLLIKDAIEKGCQHIIVGLGGSATNDGAIGIAKALGANFKDGYKKDVMLSGAGLSAIETIHVSKLRAAIAGVEIRVACDVTNPLFGEKGAAYVYGPQKGADSNMLIELDKGLRNLNRVIQKDLGLEVAEISGAGAAGGAGAGMIAFLGAKLIPGFDLISDVSMLEKRIIEADVVITGEGKLDRQTLNGKAPMGVARLAKKHNKPVFAFAGQKEHQLEDMNDLPFDSISAIYDGTKDVEDCIQNAAEYLTGRVVDVFEIYLRNCC